MALKVRWQYHLPLDVYGVVMYRGDRVCWTTAGATFDDLRGMQMLVEAARECRTRLEEDDL